MHKTGLAFFKGLTVVIQGLAKLPPETLPAVIQAIGNGFAVAVNSLEGWADKERELEYDRWQSVVTRLENLEGKGKK